MITARLQDFTASVRKGIGAGFTAGMIIIFLILIGIPVNLEALALFSFFGVVAIFSARLVRQLKAAPLGDVLKNVLVMGLVAAFLIYLLLAQINSWQAGGVNIKEKYFDAVTTKTTSILSGVPESKLFPNPSRDPLTGDYPEGEPLRTNPMRLTFGSEDDLLLKAGFSLPLLVGGIYGFLLLLIAVGLIAALITLGAMRANIGAYRSKLVQQFAQHPVVHWLVLLLPVLLFVLLWLSTTERPDSSKVFLALGSKRQEIQFLFIFMVIIGGLIAVRVAQPKDWKLNFPIRLAICLGLTIFLTALGIWHVLENQSYFVPTPDNPTGSKELSIAVVVLVGLAVAALHVWALRMPGRFEQQIALTAALCTIILLPLCLNQYQNDVLAKVGVYILLGLGLNVVVGYAGLLDLGYVAFFALGAYAYAFLSSNQKDIDTGELKFGGNAAAVVRMIGWGITAAIIASLVIAAGIYLWNKRNISQQSSSPRRNLLQLPSRPTGSVTLLLVMVAIFTSLIVSVLLDQSGLFDDMFGSVSPFFIGLLAGMVVAALFGVMLGIPVLRLRGDYLAIVTLGFGEIIRLLFNNLKDMTGGPQGLLAIPRPMEKASGTGDYMFLTYLILIGVALTALLSNRLRLSRIGRAWNAMKGDEDIAQSMGVNLVQTKLLAFAMGAMFAGMGGVLFAMRQQNIFPVNFTLDVSIQVLSLVIIGGMGSIPGVIVGAIVLIGVPEVLRELETYRILAFGALLVAMVIVRPKGLLPMPPTQLEDRARELVRRQQPTEEGQS